MPARQRGRSLRRGLEKLYEIINKSHEVHRVTLKGQSNPPALRESWSEVRPDFNASDQGRSPRATPILCGWEPSGCPGHPHSIGVAQTNNGLGDAMGSKMQPRRNIAEGVSGKDAGCPASCIFRLRLAVSADGFECPSFLSSVCRADGCKRRFVRTPRAPVR